MRGIRQVASIPIPTYGAADLGLAPNSVGGSAAAVTRLGYFVPPAGAGAEMLQGTREHVVDRLVDLIAAKGALK
jgi:electron transfer flavoprotein beta subunit